MSLLRYCLVGWLLLAGWPPLARAQSQALGPVLDWKAPTTLTTYLTQRLHTRYDQRRQELARALASGPGVQAYRDSARARFRRLLGPLPARTPLNARTVGALEQPGYRIEKVIYESQPHHHVTANLYVPAGSSPRPAALLLCGHEATAKATPSYQQTAILLAQNGFVVLVVDPVGQGERYQLTDAQGRPSTRGGTTEHTLLNAGANLVGSSLAAAELWDNVRSLDYLLARPEVDATRVGCLGNSGGATQAAYLLGYDERLQVAALCSYVAPGERALELTGPADGCVMLPGAGAAGLDVGDWPLMFAPKPLLLLPGRYDFVDFRSMQTAYDELHQADAALGQPAHAGFFAYDDGHGISRPKREAAVQWFRRWLLNDDKPVHEAPLLPVQPEAALRCTATGQVAAAFADEVGLAALTQQQAGALAAQRLGKASAKSLAPQLRQVLSLPSLADNELVEVEIRDTLRRGAVAWQALILRRAGQPPLPVLLALPPGSKAVAQVVLWLPDAGKSRLADSAALVMRHHLQAGRAVLLADLRGLGETTDPAAFNDPKYQNREYRPALLALHLGQPLPGQRTADVLTLLSFLGQQPRLRSASLDAYATGRAALPALYAAVLAPRLTHLTLPQPVVSFQQLLDAPLSPDQYSVVLPNVLARLDVLDLVRALGPKRLRFGTMAPGH